MTTNQPGARSERGSGSIVTVRLAEHVVSFAALAAGYALLAQALLTAVEIVARKLFSFSFQGVDELGGYALAVTASLGFGFATLARAHTRVDILIRILSVRVRGCLHVLASTVLLAVAVAMLWYANDALDESLLYGSIANSPLETPLWVPQALWVSGFVVFAASAAIVGFRAFSLLVRREFEQLDREFGPPSLDEAIAATIEGDAAPGAPGPDPTASGPR